MAQVLDEIVKWFEALARTKLTPLDSVEEWHRRHPRYRFLIEKHDAKIIDIGCGDGGLGTYLSWPTRMNNLHLDGCDLVVKNAPPAGYTNYIGGGFSNLENLGKYDAIIAIHLIEHLPNIDAFFELLATASAGTRIYIEWPSDESVNFPSANTLAQLSDSGALIMTSNFFDDTTHVGPNPPTAAEIKLQLSNAGWLIQESRRYKRSDNLDFASIMAKSNDAGGLTLAFWERFGFAQYIIAVKSKVSILRKE